MDGTEICCVTQYTGLYKYLSQCALVGVLEGR